MSQDEYHPAAGPETSSNEEPDAGDRENRPSGKIGVGQILRNERKKKGISYSQISEKTKVRPYILEALENEDWAHLPPRVIVTGFIRSYARALELEEGEVAGLYQKAIPLETNIPRPLVDPIVQSRKNVIIFGAFLLLTMGFAVYLLLQYPTRGRGLANPGTTGLGDKREMKSVVFRQSPGRTGFLPMDIKKNPASSLVAEQRPGVSILPSPSTREDLGEPEKSRLTLKCTVKAMTWIKVFVDEQDPKEFIFQAGEHFEWEADKGFELIIGNAGGIDLEFEGKKVEDLGGSGQVVRLNLPERYKRTGSED